MIVHSIVNNPYTQPQKRKQFSCLNQLKVATDPLKENIVRLFYEKPLIAGGALLTGAAFLVSFFSKRVLNLLPVLGIPAITLFGYEIFFNTQDLVKRV